MDLQQAINDFLSEYKPSTARAYGDVLNKMAERIGGDLPIESVTASHLRQFLAAHRQRGLSDATIVNYVKYIKTFFNWVVREGDIAVSPARNLKIPKLQNLYLDNADKAMNEDELRRILAYYRNPTRDSIRQLAIVMFLADTACRREDAATLPDNRVDLVNRTATVISKQGDAHEVHFGELTAKVLNEYVLQRGKPKGGFFFCHHRGGYTPASISQIVRRATRALRKQGINIRSLGAHSLRHRRGTQAAKAVPNPKITQRLLGHKNLETTVKSYYPASAALALEAAEQFWLTDDTGDIIPLREAR